MVATMTIPDNKRLDLCAKFAGEEVRPAPLPRSPRVLLPSFLCRPHPTGATRACASRASACVARALGLVGAEAPLRVASAHAGAGGELGLKSRLTLGYIRWFQKNCMLCVLCVQVDLEILVTSKEPWIDRLFEKLDIKEGLCLKVRPGPCPHPHPPIHTDARSSYLS